MVLTASQLTGAEADTIPSQVTFNNDQIDEGRAQHAAASVSFSVSKRHASRVVSAQAAAQPELTRSLKGARKPHKKGAKASLGLLEGRFEGHEAHLWVNHPRLQEVALHLRHKSEIHFLSRLTKQPMHKPQSL